ncbi:MAG: hypothetical protein CfP315_0275 [Candidatus Improbicoccus pseudotrichonymphae]|uniref:Uncharacterized protein n=1 Tax=Candidatus Improbicoccus pseudotrichonymphae TaxID=3033792 RepID=A0AA48KYD5_9FIRM|nr:MAG: hypothetical protein CfP315_0275 [Candidatus Improbicoccus pseudotrichonymphae]
MKKEKISNNENNKKINKNNKIISSILAVIMCCQPLVGAVAPDSQLVDSKETVEMMEGKDENEDESKKNDAVDKSEGFSSLAKTIFGVGVLGAIILGSYYIYNAIKSIGSEWVEIRNESYSTHSIGKRIENDIGFENLVVGTNYGDVLGISEFVDKISGDYSKAFSQVKVKPNHENEIGKLSSYSKFIIEITKGKKSFLSYFKNKGVNKNNKQDIVLYACKLLGEINDPEFCLINACVEVKIDGSTFYFLISQELAPYLLVADDWI